MSRALRRRYGHAGKSAGQALQIVLAKIYDDFEVTQRGRVDLGERHKTRDLKVARALMWKKKVTPANLAAEVAKAEAFARSEDYRVYVYPSSDRDSLNHAKRDLLRDLKIGPDVGRLYAGPDKPLVIP